MPELAYVGIKVVGYLVGRYTRTTEVSNTTGAVQTKTAVWKARRLTKQHYEALTLHDKFTLFWCQLFGLENPAVTDHLFGIAQFSEPFLGAFSG